MGSYTRVSWLSSEYCGHYTNPVASVTLVGDAAHVMCPFAGVGVNVGMQDALELARRLISRKAKLNSPEASVRKANFVAALKDYELEMFSRAESNAKKTWEYMNVFFNPVGAEFMVQYFGAIKAKEERAKAEVAAAKGVDLASSVI